MNDDSIVGLKREEEKLTERMKLGKAEENKVMMKIEMPD